MAGSSPGTPLQTPTTESIRAVTEQPEPKGVKVLTDGKMFTSVEFPDRAVVAQKEGVFTLHFALRMDQEGVTLTQAVALSTKGPAFNWLSGKQLHEIGEYTPLVQEIGPETPTPAPGT